MRDYGLHTQSHAVFDWSNKQNGALIGSIGIVSAALQGGYVRRATSKVGEGKMARRGVTSCAVGFGLLAMLPVLAETERGVALRCLQGAAVCMAFTSATVVNSLTSYASLQCDDGGVDKETGKPVGEDPQLAKGRALGRFRSSGQLGRAIGPLLGKCRSCVLRGCGCGWRLSAVVSDLKKIADDPFLTCVQPAPHIGRLVRPPPTQPVR